MALAKKPHRAVMLTTANALVQRMPPAEVGRGADHSRTPGNQIDMNVLVARLETSGFERVPTVRDVGEFAVRGGILDLFAPGADEALRLDFFGDTLESIRAFDVATQRTTGQRKSIALQPMSEVALTPETHQPFPPHLYRGVRRAVSATTGSMRRSARGGASPAWSTGCRSSTTAWRRCSTICRMRLSCSTIWRARRSPSGTR